MGNQTRIEWTDASWNPVTGCTKISAGCDNCYAERLTERFKNVKGHVFENGFSLTLRWERLEQPIGWKRPRMIFVNSISDLFHKHIPYNFIDHVFDTMEKSHWHTFQVLTKRTSKMQKYIKKRYQDRRVPRNIWLGASVEDANQLTRVQHLRETPASIRFLSLEPLLGAVSDISFEGIHWVIVGGESGPKARIMKPEWPREIRDICVNKEVPFFFKQWGGKKENSKSRLLDGEKWDEMPDVSGMTG